MAKICCVGPNSNINEFQKLNDVIACVEDSHIFSEAERNLYVILQISGTMEEVKSQMSEVVPEMSTNEKGENIWKDEDGYWKKIAKLKHKVRYEDNNFISNVQRYPKNFVKTV